MAEIENALVSRTSILFDVCKIEYLKNWLLQAFHQYKKVSVGNEYKEVPDCHIWTVCSRKIFLIIKILPQVREVRHG